MRRLDDLRCDFDNRPWKSARGWESAKERLEFGKVTQDGDCEGLIFLDQLPPKAEAAHIRISSAFQRKLSCLPASSQA
jgi:hypothetical protein